MLHYCKLKKTSSSLNISIWARGGWEERPALVVIRLSLVLSLTNLIKFWQLGSIYLPDPFKPILNYHTYMHIPSWYVGTAGGELRSLEARGSVEEPEPFPMVEVVAALDVGVTWLEILEIATVLESARVLADSAVGLDPVVALLEAIAPYIAFSDSDIDSRWVISKCASSVELERNTWPQMKHLSWLPPSSPLRRHPSFVSSTCCALVCKIIQDELWDGFC